MGILLQVNGLHGLILPQVIGLHWANTAASDFLNTAASDWIILPQVMGHPKIATEIRNPALHPSLCNPLPCVLCSPTARHQ